MTKRMLIDSTHAEETRVVVLDGNRLEDFDVETSTKRQLKGNIYLAKVVRVEPSLQAAFVEYGGNRHGFLAFGEIHPDYYQIPVADRQRLIEMEAEEARREEEEADLELALHQSSATAETPETDSVPEAAAGADTTGPDTAGPEPWALAATPLLIAPPPRLQAPDEASSASASLVAAHIAEPWAMAATPPLLASAAPVPAAAQAASDDDEDADEVDTIDPIPESPPPETVGGNDESGDERSERRMPSRFLRNYKIQEVIRRRQILLVQVVKEERGTKGAALTTYLSLAGRFCVLMPNSPRGGGISRKITSATDRRRLKEIMTELDIPKGMGLIVRTAGAQRPKPEIKRDCEYLLRLWDDIREHTLKSIAPALIYEEASLIKRAIRDVYSRDIDEILVDGEDGWRSAHDFMRMLMPSHAKKVQLWRDGGMPLFSRHQVEAQLDGMLLPIVQLRSGGYLVINQAEALVAIDVNSGRSTRERNVEETALRTNLEAADEVARQLRLRDLAGLIVIDFIDMESKRHNAMVERRLKEALKNDRARIQVGHISHFGLLEMSRQRLRPSLAETSFIPCPHCGGTGHVRSTESAAIHVLRGIEEEGGKRRSAEIVVHMATPIALYILNHKRERLREIELRYAMKVIVAADDAQTTSQFRIDRVKAQIAGEAPAVITPDVRPQPALAAPAPEPEPEEEEEPVSAATEEEAEEDEAEGDEAARADGAEGSSEGDRRRRRRRRRRGRREDGSEPGATETGAAETGAAETGAPEAAMPAEAGAPAEMPAETPAETAAETAGEEATHIEGVPEHSEPESEPAADGEDDGRGRRRGRRGGRRRRREGDGTIPAVGMPGAEQPDLTPAYSGPTPANPFGGQAFDIFDVMEQVELSAAAASRRATPPATEADGDEIINPGAPEVMLNPSTASAEPVETGTLTPGADEPAAAVEAAPAVAEVAVEEAGDVVSAPAADVPQADAIAAAADAIASVPAMPAPEAAGAAADGEATAVPAAVAAGEPEPPADAAAAAPESVMAESAMAESAMAEPAVAAAMEPASAEEAVPVAANDSIPEPLVKPVVIGADAPPAEKKRGWWRR